MNKINANGFSESRRPAIHRTMDRSPDRPRPWVSLWIVALLSLLGQLWICQFFSFGTDVPLSIDVNPSNLWKYAYQFPPRGEFLVLNWLGVANLPPSLNPFSLAAAVLPVWVFFTTYTPAIGTLALLAMAAFLRELEIPRPAALFGAVIFAWQGDLLPFVFPGHFAYIATWPFYAVAAWGALRSQRTGHWACGVISGAACGTMVALQPDRGGIASLLVAALFLAAAWRYPAGWRTQVKNLALCVAVALVVALASLLALFQSFIVGVSLGGDQSRADTYKYATQFSYGPEETLTYLVPGFFGWHSSSLEGPYWGRIGQWPDWPKDHKGLRNLNLAISTTGTIATALAILAAILMLPVGSYFGPSGWSERQVFFARVLLALGAVALVLSWGWHTPLYRIMFALPLMDKWRNPLKWLEMTNFALVTLSALGLQHLFGFLEEAAPVAGRAHRRSAWILYSIAALLIAGLVASYPFTLQLAPKLLDAGYDAGSVAAIMATVHTSLFAAVTLIALACALILVLQAPGFMRRWKLENPWLHRLWQAMLEPGRLPLTLSLGLALFSVAQLAWVATRFVSPGELAALTETNPLVEDLRDQGNKVRVSVDSSDPLLNVLLQNQFAIPQISCLEISAASRLPDALTSLFDDLKSNPARLWFLAGVKNRVVPEASFEAIRHDPRLMTNIDHVDGYSLEPTDSPNLPSHALVQFKDYLAKATFVPQAEILPSDDAVLQRLKDPNWDPRATILFSNTPGEKLAPATRSGTAKSAGVEVSDHTAHRIDLTVTAPEAGYILINDAYDPDWAVEVNGQATPLLRADYLFRAVPVPAGTSTVALRYNAHYRVAGLSLPTEAVNFGCDAAMLAAWIAAGVALWRERANARGGSGTV